MCGCILHHIGLQPRLHTVAGLALNERTAELECIASDAFAASHAYAASASSAASSAAPHRQQLTHAFSTPVGFRNDGGGMGGGMGGSMGGGGGSGGGRSEYLGDGDWPPTYAIPATAAAPRRAVSAAPAFCAPAFALPAPGHLPSPRAPPAASYACEQSQSCSYSYTPDMLATREHSSAGAL